MKNTIISARGLRKSFVHNGGQDIVKLSEKKLAVLRRSDFGFIFQQMHLVSNLSLFENITVPGYLNKNVSAADTDKRADRGYRRLG